MVIVIGLAQTGQGLTCVGWSKAVHLGCPPRTAGGGLATMMPEIAQKLRLYMPGFRSSGRLLSNNHVLGKRPPKLQPALPQSVIIHIAAGLLLG